jgi:hypothetical protein
MLGAGVAAIVLIASPECLSGPYGMVSPELKAIWLANITEAQPIYLFAVREPVGAVTNFGPPAVAFVVALRKALARDGRNAAAWGFAAAVLGTALALSFHQVRTIPYASAVAIPVLAAWLGGLAAAGRATGGGWWMRARHLLVPVLLSFPAAYLAVAWVGIRGVEAASGGRIAPPRLAVEENVWAEGLTRLEADCQDRASAQLLAAVPPALVLTPLFYGPTVLALSDHSVVAAPYHREGEAILDAINAMRFPPDRARAVFAERNVAYLAICSTDRSSAKARARSPQGLHARLLAGDSVGWLQPVAYPAETSLRLWRVLPTVALRP